MDLAAIDKMLTTTRSVRKRLDFSRAVRPEIVEECLRIAIQAPTGSNAQGWSFVVVTDAEKRKKLGEIYRKAFAVYVQMNTEAPPPYAEGDPRLDQLPRVFDSASHLAEHMHEAPVHVIPCVAKPALPLDGALGWASLMGSILPAAWSLMIALRARGIGSAWTTLHLMHEKEAADLLGIPDDVIQTALLPIAYFTGDDFKPAKRLPLEEITHWNGWGRKRS